VLLDAELQFYRAMADVCAQALERVRVQHTVDVQRQRLAVLARASQELAGSLDVESMLSIVASWRCPTTRSGARSPRSGTLG
jgi:hypothetical protein